MAISRPLLLALIGLALLGATVFAVNNARNSGGDSAATADPAAQAANQATPASEPAAPAGPDELLAAAVASETDSASFDARLSFSSQGEKNTVRVSGAYETHGEREMPEAAVKLQLNAPSANLNANGGFVTTGERAWFTRGNAAYAVPASVWNQIVKGRESGAPPAEGASKDLEISPRDWVRNVKSEGTERVSGVQATHLSAQLDSAKAVTDVVSAWGKAAGSAVPVQNAEQRLRQAGLEDGKLDVWVGDDKILRKLTLSLAGQGTGGRRVTAELDLQLTAVNEPQDIAAPANVRRGLPGGTYGQVANGVLASAAEEAGVNPEDLRLGVPVTNSHLKAERAVAANQKVVLFFTNPRALDDKAVARSVRALDRRTKKVVVLTDDVRNADRYETLLEDLQVSQAPAIVVIGRSGNADLIEGYVDADALVQVVADAR